MKLVPSLMCILIHLSSLPCSGKFYKVAKLLVVSILRVNVFAGGINRLDFSQCHYVVSLRKTLMHPYPVPVFANFDLTLLFVY